MEYEQFFYNIYGKTKRQDKGARQSPNGQARQSKGQDKALSGGKTKRQDKGARQSPIGRQGNIKGKATLRWQDNASLARQKGKIYFVLMTQIF